MAVVLLPPGNRIKILEWGEIEELAEALKKEGDAKERLKVLETKWDNGVNIYDIDIISLAATPLSQFENFKRGREIAKEIVENRKRMEKEWKWQKRMQAKVVNKSTFKNAKKRKLETIKEEESEQDLQQQPGKREESVQDWQAVFAKTFGLPVKEEGEVLDMHAAAEWKEFWENCM